MCCYSRLSCVYVYTHKSPTKVSSHWRRMRWNWCMCAMIPFEKMIDGLFGKHSKIITRKKRTETRSHFAIMIIRWWWWWCENTNINTASAEHNELPHLCGVRVCDRAPNQTKFRPQFNRQAVWVWVQIYKSSSGFSSFPRLVLLPNSYARDIFMNCVCARACTVYTFCANRLTNKSIQKQKPNEMKQAG